MRTCFRVRPRAGSAWSAMHVAWCGSTRTSFSRWPRSWMACGSLLIARTARRTASRPPCSHSGAEVLAFFDAPDGQNINDGCGATAPGALQRLVVDRKADVGFAFDGDGDRVIVV